MNSWRENQATTAGNPEPPHSLATLFIQQGKLREAEEYFRQPLSSLLSPAEQPTHPGTLKKLPGELGTAAEEYRETVTLQPQGSDYHFNLATVLHKQGALQEAAACYKKALALRPDDFEAHYSLGVTYHRMGNLAAAAPAYVRALQINPNCAEAYTNLGALCQELGDLRTAAGLQRQALALAPAMPEAYVNLGVVLSQLNDCHGAVTCFLQALTKDPGHAGAHCNLGFVLEKQGDLEGAQRCYRQALACKPDSDEARFYLGVTHLLQGDYANGWQEYEARWGTKEFRRFRRTFSQPLWRGQPLPGARILLHAEQGLGDTIQFVRFVPLVAARGGQVVLEVQPELRRLLANFPGVSCTITRGETPPEFTWHCPLMSLPLAFGTQLTNIPAAIPYLRADAARVQTYSGRVERQGLRIGLAWAGNPTHSRERQRSITLAQLEPLTRIAGTTFYSLQRGAAASQIRGLPSIKLSELDSQGKDFADTAALVANLDLVISVDTATAHLAGALGKPVWILLHHMPDWRWLQQGATSLWYPTARLFRQTTPGDWRPVIDSVRAELERAARQFHR